MEMYFEVSAATAPPRRCSASIDGTLLPSDEFCGATKTQSFSPQTCGKLCQKFSRNLAPLHSCFGFGIFLQIQAQGVYARIGRHELSVLEILVIAPDDVMKQ